MVLTHAFGAGMSYIAAVLLLNVEAPVAFQCFCNLISRHFYFDLIGLDAAKVRIVRSDCKGPSRKCSSFFPCLAHRWISTCEFTKRCCYSTCQMCLLTLRSTR